MTMKNAEAPRKVYNRNGFVHVCFAGTVYGVEGESKIDLRAPVKIVQGEGEITVSQRRNKKKGISETWKPVNVPRKHRAA